MWLDLILKKHSYFYTANISNVKITVFTVHSGLKSKTLVKTAKNTNICSVLHFKNWLQAPLVTCKHKHEATPTWVSFWQLPDNWDTRGAIPTTVSEFDQSYKLKNLSWLYSPKYFCKSLWIVFNQSFRNWWSPSDVWKKKLYRFIIIWQVSFWYYLATLCTKNGFVVRLLSCDNR